MPKKDLEPARVRPLGFYERGVNAGLMSAAAGIQGTLDGLMTHPKGTRFTVLDVARMLEQMKLNILDVSIVAFEVARA